MLCWQAVVCAVLTCCVLPLFAASQATDAIAPEATTALQINQRVTAERFMVAAANPLAVEAGYQVLQQGGSAIDAMVAVQTVLGLVEPQSSGLGGGAFLLYYDAENKSLSSWDGRETAPLAATPELFQDAAGEPLKFYDAVVGGRSVGTPATVKLMAELHQRYGELDWASLLQPATELAEQGFAISPRLAESIADDAERLGRYETTRAYFLQTDGSPKPAGFILANPEYAQTLKTLAKDGEAAFYRGKIAQDIVTRVTELKDNPGLLSLHDLAVYQVKERPPVCAAYRQYDICGMGPPSSGALAVGQIMGMLSHFDLAAMGADAAQAWQIIGDASRLAFADRGRYMADTDFVPMPEGLLALDYLAQRAGLITPGQALNEVAAGEPPWRLAVQQADDESLELPSTSHLVIVDGDGNIVSMTTTIENGFGSRVMTNGFLLNNELTDFSFVSHRHGQPIANRLEPGKRPRSSMAPTIVFKDGEPYMALGSPGGSHIIGYVVKTLVAHLDWGLDVQAAIDLPNMVNRFGTYDLEQGTAAEGFQSALKAMGFKTKVRDLNSGVQAILLSHTSAQGRLQGGADGRREGQVLGE